LESGKRQLSGDTLREASSNEVKELRDENDELKMLVAELSLRTRMLKKTVKGSEYASIDT
jgi:transposase